MLRRNKMSDSKFKVRDPYVALTDDGWKVYSKFVCQKKGKKKEKTYGKKVHRWPSLARKEGDKDGQTS